MLGQIPEKLAESYPTLAGADLHDDAVDLINRALDALQGAAALKAALDPMKSGIFNHYTDGSNDEQDFVGDDGKIGTRDAGQILDQLSYKVSTTLGSTSFTRFGAWRREDTRNAIQGSSDSDPSSTTDEDPRVLKDKGGPGTFAYSSLDAARAGTLTNPGFPARGSARYIGETVAWQNATVLVGTVQVDVGWDAVPAALADLGGTMSLTISDLQSTAGDPLSQGGSAKAEDGTGGSAGNEIGDIVFSGINIRPGLVGPNEGHLIVGTANETTVGDETINIYSEIAPESGDLRYRFTGAGVVDHVVNNATSGVKALFVGQGVDGPLGVIGTWMLNDDTVGRVSADGSETADQVGVAIYGAFGADAP